MLPELRGRVPLPYVAVFRQVLSQEVDLEMVGFLGGYEIRTVSPKKVDHAFFAIVHALGPSSARPNRRFRDSTDSLFIVHPKAYPHGAK